MEWAYNINPTELKLIFFFTPFGAVLRNYQNGASDVRYHRIYLYWWYAIYTDRTIYSSAFHLKKKAQNISQFNYDSLAFISKAPNKVADQIECQYDWFNSEYKLEKKNEREKNRKRNSFPIIWLNCTQNCIWKAAGSKQTFFKSTTFLFLARSQTSRHTHTHIIHYTSSHVSKLLLLNKVCFLHTKEKKLVASLPAAYHFSFHFVHLYCYDDRRFNSERQSKSRSLAGWQ